MPGIEALAERIDTLMAEMTLRAQLPARFAPMLRDAAFRTEVNKHMTTHPEWGPVVAADNKLHRENRR